jgi:hypothetical protein
MKVKDIVIGETYCHMPRGWRKDARTPDILEVVALEHGFTKSEVFLSRSSIDVLGKQKTLHGWSREKGARGVAVIHPASGQIDVVQPGDLAPVEEARQMYAAHREEQGRISKERFDSVCALRARAYAVRERLGLPLVPQDKIYRPNSPVNLEELEWVLARMEEER